jgi:hypothetical protein
MHRAIPVNPLFLLQQVMLQCYVDERQAQVYGSDVHARGKLWMRSV